jgi:hypothetical protein
MPKPAAGLIGSGDGWRCGSSAVGLRRQCADAVALVHSSGRSEFHNTQEPLEDAWGCHVARTRSFSGRTDDLLHLVRSGIPVSRSAQRTRIFWPRPIVDRRCTGFVFAALLPARGARMLAGGRCLCSHLPHLPRDWSSSTLSHLHRDWACPLPQLRPRLQAETTEKMKALALSTPTPKSANHHITSRRHELAARGKGPWRPSSSLGAMHRSAMSWRRRR